MKSLLRSLLLWSVLTGIVWLFLLSGLAPSISIWAGIARMLSMPLAVLLTWWAVLALPSGRLARWGFWTITMAGWLAAGLLAEGRMESKAHPDDRQVMALCLAAAGILAI